MEAWILPGLCLLIAVLTTIGFGVVNLFRDKSMREENRKLREMLAQLAGKSS